MKDISIYFQAVEIDQDFDKESLGQEINLHTPDNFPDIKEKGVALIFTPENRRNNKYTTENEDSFRKDFYQMYKGSNWNHSIYDLGTINPGEKIEDTVYAISAVCQELIKSDIVPLVVGGSQDLTIALYKAYENLEQLINLTTVDHKLDLGTTENEPREDQWLSHILLHKPCFLFNYTNIGAQSHYISPSTLDLFNDLYFDICRLGNINQDSKLAEPIMRNTDILSFDLESIRSSELSNGKYTSPNGLFANEACQLMRYAGISDKLTSIGIFNCYTNQNEKTTNELIAQMIWYFNEGYASRKGDFPIGSKRNYKKYRVTLEELKDEIVFSKSDKSGRWWMEVPYPGIKGHRFERHQLVPCSYEVYQEAMKGEVPDLWWKTYQKLA